MVALAAHHNSPTIRTTWMLQVHFWMQIWKKTFTMNNPKVFPNEAKSWYANCTKPYLAWNNLDKLLHLDNYLLPQGICFFFDPNTYILLSKMDKLPFLYLCQWFVTQRTILQKSSWFQKQLCNKFAISLLGNFLGRSLIYIKKNLR